MRNINYPEFLSRITAKNVHDKDKAAQCDLCKLWIHIKCNNFNYLNYRYLQNFMACCTSTDSNKVERSRK